MEELDLDDAGIGDDEIKPLEDDEEEEALPGEVASDPMEIEEEI